MKSIQPEMDLKDVLLHVEKPGRYTGGEFGNKKQLGDDTLLKIILCFPDMYEIGMSNNAIRILYDQLNRIDGVLCDLLFSPATDFEAVLAQKGLPLYGLVSGLPVKDFDILAFSVGYELSATNMLAILEASFIPLHGSERDETDPVVIAGGPAVTNPIPFLRWIDGVFIGESEAPGGLTTIVQTILDAHIDRLSIMNAVTASPHVYSKKRQSARAAIDTAFTRRNERPEYYVVPSISIIQEHGVIEIMRGCPNGCRFCHAGELYKPYRQKNIEQITHEVKQNIATYGYREITLSSLSSGDYPQLGKLITYLNNYFKDKHISFSLPSLKVNSFTLPILEAVSSVRRSGLTFAIETPDAEWQKAMNKVVDIQQVISIILQAKKHGWKLAKFYFMVGLPFTDISKEAEKITEFISQVYRSTGIRININIGTFVPKPHTPFQWSAQLDPETAFDHLLRMKQQLQDRVPRIKINFHDPRVSLIEGMISRGDERAGIAVEEAFKAGAKMDAWNEFFRWDTWEHGLEQANIDIMKDICLERSPDGSMPWEQVTVGSSKAYKREELEKSSRYDITSPCAPDCSHLCGVCKPKRGDVVVEDAENTNAAMYEHPVIQAQEEKSKSFDHIVLEYSKLGRAVYLSHINMMHCFEALFQRLDIDIEFTHGFNPKPRFEFLSPLPLGMEGHRELMVFRIASHSSSEILGEDFLTKATSCLPEGVALKRLARKGLGHKSASASYSGAEYRITAHSEDDFLALRELFDKLVTEHPHVTVIEANHELNSITIQIREQKNATSNILKLSEQWIERYDFLSRYSVERQHPLAGPKLENAFAYLSKDKQ